MGLHLHLLQVSGDQDAGGGLGGDVLEVVQDGGVHCVWLELIGSWEDGGVCTQVEIVQLVRK